MEFYKLKINKPNGDKISMQDYKGKVVLIVNTATQCGLTPQFEGLEKLHQSYKDQGLVILGTPCNQFGGQEPLNNKEMVESCQVNHGVSFQLTEKIKVNGSDTHPLYKYLKSELGSILGSKIKWNFTKFLIDRDGKPFKRYAPTTKPSKIEQDILKLI
jgi:glutathione peroxidase